ncbi:hypothetical protein V1T76_08510 [Roseibium sp. FZY0029]|uniref:hypothetical protein n=1 Tax=Roseibium sp. FZY0029 TaxID=3116647 RepID=UPI002E9C5D56|nr:hypothetical protein [Roseibium sp. FZY0029]
MIRHTPDFDVTRKVNNWSTRAKIDPGAVAQFGMTDGKFIIGLVETRLLSLILVGSLAVLTVQHKDFGPERSLRKKMMVPIGAYGGIATS